MIVFYRLVGPVIQRHVKLQRMMENMHELTHKVKDSIWCVEFEAPFPHGQICVSLVITLCCIYLCTFLFFMKGRTYPRGCRSVTISLAFERVWTASIQLPVPSNTQSKRGMIVHMVKFEIERESSHMWGWVSMIPINQITQALWMWKKSEKTFCTCELTRLIALSQDHPNGHVFCKSNGEDSWSAGSSYTGQRTMANLGR